MTRPAGGIATAAAAGAALLLLAGCGGTSRDIAADVGALGVGTAVGAATGNPAIGIAAGIGARIAADEGYKYGERRYFGAVQAAIATAAGAAEPGAIVPWSVEGIAGIGDRSGRIEVVRVFGERLTCKELIFTVEPPPERSDESDEPGEAVEPGPDTDTDVEVGAEPQPPLATEADLAGVLPEGTEVLTTTICEAPDGWAWAGTRPKTSRWGGLQ
ncbi:MAG: hypothetical protein RID91_07610 [Azospirillaceae bacterium]